MCADNGDISSTGSIIRNRATETVLTRGFYGFLDWPDDPFLSDLVEAAPGSEKSRISTEIGTRVWMEHGEPSLYLMLTHEAISQRLRHIREDGNSDHWKHYKGHAKNCLVSQWAALGYSGISCNCDHASSTLSPEKPTLAAVDVILRDHTTPEGFLDDVHLFKLWIVDEIDLGRFVGSHAAALSDLHAVRARYPSYSTQAPSSGELIDLGSVRTLADGLLEIYDQLLAGGEERINGRQLYRSFSLFLIKQNINFQQFIINLESLIDYLPHQPWDDAHSSSLRSQPKNFPRYLLPVLCQEAANYLNGNEFYPRIHITNTGQHSGLLVRWRRQVAELKYPGPGLEQDTDINLMILDATAEPEIIGKVFPEGMRTHHPTEPEWPSNVYVTQWADNTVSKSQLGLYGDEWDDITPDEVLENWFQRVIRELEAFDKKTSIGVITHKQIETLLVKRLNAAGYNNVSSMHFYNLRGSNQFERNRVLVILGCPIPNMSGFREECEAFFYDDDRELVFNPTSRTSALAMRDGRSFAVNTFGYWQPPVSNYYRQKCHAELYQAIHRLRPYRQRKYDRHIILFTNMPIKGVEVDHVLVDEDKNWKWDAAQELQKRLKTSSSVTPDQLYSAAKVSTRTIVNNADSIAILAGAWFFKGKRGSGGSKNRFTLSPLD